MLPFLIENTDDPFQRTRALFGGVISEFRKRAPQYRSDITDCLSPICIAAVIYIYFAALAAALALGGLHGMLLFPNFSSYNYKYIVMKRSLCSCVV